MPELTGDSRGAAVSEVSDYLRGNSALSDTVGRLTDIQLFNFSWLNPDSNADPGVPGSFSIIESKTENMDSYKYFYYQLNNVNGQPLTGPGYMAAEHISVVSNVSGARIETTNGQYNPLNGGVLRDTVGFTVTPNKNQDIVVTQTFSVLYQGYFYQLPTVFQHHSVATFGYSNGGLRYSYSNTVTVVEP